MRVRRASALHQSSFRQDADVVDEPGAAEASGGQEPRRAVEPDHWRQIGGVAQFEIIGRETRLAECGKPVLQRGGDILRRGNKRGGGVDERAIQMRRYLSLLTRQIDIARGKG